MKKAALFLGIIAVFLGCSGNEKTTGQNVNPNVHKGVALETMNATKYTYLLVNENGVEKWLAFPISEVKVGETYYYMNEMPMANFESKDLGRTFPQISFLEGVSLDPQVFNATAAHAEGIKNAGENMNPVPVQPAEQHKGSAGVNVEKLEVKVEQAKGGVSIAELLAHKDKYAGKKVVVKGKVAKYNPDVMDINWVHIQDGTDSKGAFDLTVTTHDQVKLGDIVTFEGVVAINKDFGAGYVYEIIVENAQVKK